MAEVILVCFCRFLCRQLFHETVAGFRQVYLDHSKNIWKEKAMSFDFYVIIYVKVCCKTYWNLEKKCIFASDALKNLLN